jgi:hypothetical protein
MNDGEVTNDLTAGYSCAVDDKRALAKVAGVDALLSAASARDNVRCAKGKTTLIGAIDVDPTSKSMGRSVSAEFGRLTLTS